MDNRLLSAARLGALEMAKLLGVSDGEISYNAARKVYGRWFMDAVASGALQHVRRNGDRGMRVYSIADILALKASERKPISVL